MLLLYHQESIVEATIKSLINHALDESGYSNNYNQDSIQEKTRLFQPLSTQAYGVRYSLMIQPHYGDYVYL